MKERMSSNPTAAENLAKAIRQVARRARSEEDLRVGVTTTFRRKTSPRPRVLRLAAPVVVENAGRRALCSELVEEASVCARATVRI